MPEPRAADITAAGDATFGSGHRVTDLMLALDRLIYALTMAGYHVMAVGCRPGQHSGGDWIYVTSVDTMRFVVGQGDWADAVGADPSASDSFVVSLHLEERTRFLGAGPTFAIDLPSLAGAATPGGVGGGWIQRTTVFGGDRPNTIQVDVQPDASTGDLDAGLVALRSASEVVAALVSLDLENAADGWNTTPGLDPQPGLASIFDARGWQHHMAWIELHHIAAIDALGGEITNAIEAGDMSIESVVADDIAGAGSFGDLLATARALDTVPSVASTLDEMLTDRYRGMWSDWDLHVNFFAGAHHQPYGRTLMVAHELRVIDVLGHSALGGSDVDHVIDAAADFDVTGFYETRYPGWDSTTAVAMKDLARTEDIALLQLNQAGSVVTGFWQMRQIRLLEPTEVTTHSYRVVGAVHPVNGSDQPHVSFTATPIGSFAGRHAAAAFTGLFRLSDKAYDDDGEDFRPTLTVQFGTPVDGAGDVAEGDVPVAADSGLCPVADYWSVSTHPHVSDELLASLDPVVLDRATSSERFPAHSIEQLIVHWTLLDIEPLVQSYVSSSGATKRNLVGQVNDAAYEQLGRYLHDDDVPGVIHNVRQRFRAEVMAATAGPGTNVRTIYDWIVEMALNYPSETTDLVELLDLGELTGGLSPTIYQYDWSYDITGFYADVVVIEGGGYRGTMTITKRLPGGPAMWTAEYDMWVGETGIGPGIGANFWISSGNTVLTDLDWSEETFEGTIDFDSVGAGVNTYVYSPISFSWEDWVDVHWPRRYRVSINPGLGSIAFYGTNPVRRMQGPDSGFTAKSGINVSAGYAYSLGYLWLRNPEAPESPPDADEINGLIRNTAIAGDYLGADPLFDSESAIVRPEVIDRLERLAADHLAALATPWGRLLVVGHASAAGGSGYNHDLSLARAEAVYQTLKILVGGWLAVPEERTEIVARGELDAPGGPDGPDVQSARRVEMFMDGDQMIGY